MTNLTIWWFLSRQNSSAPTLLSLGGGSGTSLNRAVPLCDLLISFSAAARSEMRWETKNCTALGCGRITLWASLTRYNFALRLEKPPVIFLIPADISTPSAWISSRNCNQTKISCFLIYFNISMREVLKSVYFFSYLIYYRVFLYSFLLAYMIFDEGKKPHSWFILL